MTFSCLWFFTWVGIHFYMYLWSTCCFLVNWPYKLQVPDKSWVGHFWIRMIMVVTCLSMFAGLLCIAWFWPACKLASEGNVTKGHLMPGMQGWRVARAVRWLTGWRRALGLASSDIARNAVFLVFELASTVLPGHSRCARTAHFAQMVTKKSHVSWSHLATVATCDIIFRNKQQVFLSPLTDGQLATCRWAEDHGKQVLACGMFFSPSLLSL